MKQVHIFQDEDYFYRLTDDADVGFPPRSVTVDEETAIRWRLIEKAFWDMQEEIFRLRRKESK